MTPSTTARTGPRYWVVGITVFLTVVLAGLAVPGASALWSQQANATVSVTTGHWKNTQPGWSVKMTLGLENVRWDGLFSGNHTATLVVTPDAQDLMVPGMSFQVSVVALNRGSAQVGAASFSNGQIRVPIEVQRGWLETGSNFRIVVTPVLNGSHGTPMTRDARSSGSSFGWSN